MHSDPVYTVDEARALLPQVRATLLQLAIQRHRAEEAHAALHDQLGTESDGSASAQQALEITTAELRDGARALLEHLASLGIVVRDLETGLVDFPTVRDGEPAWLCWRLDDPDVAWWHTTREGFASRRPL